MRRFHLFEILDQSWCPRMLREGTTDCLEAIICASDVYRPLRSGFLAAIRQCAATRIVDLCSGGGGPWLSPQWAALLDGDPQMSVKLTDKFPSGALRARLNHSTRLVAIERPVDATDVPEELEGFRTVFSSFHHFPDRTAEKILRDAVRSRQGFASAEVTSRSMRAILIMFAMPLLSWCATLRIRPFSWSRLIFTYAIPAIPFILFWDGLVSCLRTRTPGELLALTGSLPEYAWKAGYARGPGVWLAPVYLIGCPRESALAIPAHGSLV